MGSIKKVFKNTLGNCNYIFPSGKVAVFIGGEYLTSDEEEIEHLNKEIKRGHPNIYVDPQKSEVDTTLIDSLEEVKRKAVDEFLKQRERALNSSNSPGDTMDAKNFLKGMANTRNDLNSAKSPEDMIRKNLAEDVTLVTSRTAPVPFTKANTPPDTQESIKNSLKSLTQKLEQDKK